jgi:hypothetical protein
MLIPRAGNAQFASLKSTATTLASFNAATSSIQSVSGPTSAPKFKVDKLKSSALWRVVG